MSNESTHALMNGEEMSAMKEMSDGLYNSIKNAPTLPANRFAFQIHSFLGYLWVEAKASERPDAGMQKKARNSRRKIRRAFPQGTTAATILSEIAARTTVPDSLKAIIERDLTLLDG